jgi:hypothetical protein
MARPSGKGKKQPFNQERIDSSRIFLRWSSSSAPQKTDQDANLTYDLVLIVSQANAFLVSNHRVESVIGVVDDVLGPRQ